MLKNIVIALGIILFSSHSFAIDKNQINLDQSFWGNWSVFNPRSACTENYQFVKPGRFVYQAQSKQLTGQFAVLRSADKTKLDQLLLEISADNGGLGCGGDTNNYHGQNSGFFLKWLSYDSAELCIDNVGKRCIGLYLNRK